MDRVHRLPVGDGIYNRRSGGEFHHVSSGARTRRVVRDSWPTLASSRTISPRWDSVPDATRGHTVAHAASVKVAECRTGRRYYPAMRESRGPGEPPPRNRQFFLPVRILRHLAFAIRRALAWPTVPTTPPIPDNLALLAVLQNQPAFLRFRPSRLQGRQVLGPWRCCNYQHQRRAAASPVRIKNFHFACGYPSLIVFILIQLKPSRDSRSQVAVVAHDKRSDSVENVGDVGFLGS